MGLAIVAAGCGSSSPSSSAGSDAASASVASTDKSSFDLAVGDCFDTEDLSAVTRVSVVDCAGPHTYEVFGAAPVPAGASASFPGADALNAAADAACRPDFEAYVGVDFNDSDLVRHLPQPVGVDVGDRGPRDRVRASPAGPGRGPRLGEGQREVADLRPPRHAVCLLPV